MTDAPELLPCPFCGKTPEPPVDATRILGVWRVFHRGCTVLPNFAVERSNRDATIAAWNTRAEADRQAQEAVAAALMEAADLMARHTAEDDPVLLQKSMDDFEEKDGRSDHSRRYRAHLIRALIPDAARLLEERDARVREEALMDAAIYFGADEETAEEMIAAIREGK